MKKKILNLIVISMLMIFMLPFLGGAVIAKASPQQTTIKIDILTRHSSSLYRTVEKAFKESDYAPKDVSFDLVFRSLDISVWKSVIDDGNTYVAWGGGPTLFDDLLKDGYLQPITEPNILDEIAYLRQNEWENDSIAGSAMFRNGTALNDDKIYWAGSAIASFGYTVCTAVLQQVDLQIPRGWHQLAHPGYYFDNPLIAIGSSAGSTSNTRIYEIILQAFGWELGWGILSMIAGNALITEGSTGAKQAVEQCNVGIANTIDFYGFDAQLNHANNLYILPNNQSIVNADPIAFTINGGDPQKLEIAKAFVNFVLSAEGQAVLLHDNIKRMPIRSDAFDKAPDSPEYSHVDQLREIYQNTINNQGIEFNETLSLSYLNSMIYYLEATLHEIHNDLRDVMRSARTAYDANKLTTTQLFKLAMALGKPVGSPAFTQEYAQQINDQMGSDDAFRTSKQAEWKDAARQKYSSIKSQLDSITSSTDFGVSDNDIAGLTNPWENFVLGSYDGPPVEGAGGAGGTNTTQGLIPGFEAIVLFLSFGIVISIHQRRRKNKHDQSN